MKRVYSLILSLGCFILVIDQWTKQHFLEILKNEGDSIPVFGWWSWTLVYNRAAAFGIFGTLPDFLENFRVLFLLLLPSTILFCLWFFWVRHFQKDELFRPVVMGLVFGGAIGNIIDRIRFGYVIDFIDWFYPSSSGKCIPKVFFVGHDNITCHWPVFNIADSAITAAMILIAYETLFIRRHELKK